MPKKEVGGDGAVSPNAQNAANPNLPRPNPKTTGRKNCKARHTPNPIIEAVLQPERLFVV